MHVTIIKAGHGFSQMHGWKMTGAKSRWSTNNDPFAWSFNEGALFGRGQNGLPTPALTNDQQAQLYTSVSLTHPEDFDFCCESAIILDSLIGHEEDAALVRRTSLTVWRPSRSTALHNSVYGESEGVVVDSAFKMAFSLLQHYDRKGLVAEATEVAKLLSKIATCSESKGLPAKKNRAARLSYSGWLATVVKSANLLCAKYGTELSPAK